MDNLMVLMMASSAVQRLVLLILYAFTESYSWILSVWSYSVSVVIFENYCGEEILF